MRQDRFSNNSCTQYRSHSQVLVQWQDRLTGRERVASQGSAGGYRATACAFSGSQADSSMTMRSGMSAA